jgi:7 transmembrane sweet-taste receptor of 3 GCPR
VCTQLLITAITVVTSPPTVGLRMPVPTERLVEITCAVPVEGYVTSLVFNVMLIVVCTWYAFKTRMLPDNFNESRYITLCVYTTLVIWLAFVPSYFTTIHAYQRLVLTSSALALNATVMLLCLFTPRIYAIYHDAGNGGTGSMIGRCSVARASSGGCSVMASMTGTATACGGGNEHRQKVAYRGAGQLRRTLTLTSSPCCSVQTGGTIMALVNTERSV